MLTNNKQPKTGSLAAKVVKQQADAKAIDNFTYNFDHLIGSGIKKYGKTVIDITELTGNIAQKVMFGKPVIITGTKKYTKIANEINLQALGHKAEKVMFEYGNTHVILFKKGSGRMGARLADPNFPNKVVRIAGVPYQAVIWSIIKVDRTNFYVKETYDYKKIYRQIYTDLKMTTEIPLNIFNGKLPDDVEVKPVENHNLGFLPVVEGWRKPTWDYASPYKVKGLYKFGLQSLMDETTTSLRLENKNNRTRVLIDQEYVNKADRGSISKLANSDIFVKLDGTGSAPGEKKAFEIMKGDPAFDKYWASINNILRVALQTSGYSDLQDGESSNPTATGAIFTKANDIETTSELAQFRQEFLKEILIKCSAYASGKKISEDDIFDDKLTVEIVPNIIFNELNLTTTLAKQKEMGWISDADAITRLSGISKDDAKTKIDEMDDENVEVKEQPGEEQPGVKLPEEKEE